jgi:Raf kinase inhibitor-like YbhB/YbcL family protein
MTSTAFRDGGEIPKKYTQDADGLSPPLMWTDVPPGTRSLALVVDDPDAPDPAAPRQTWVHWVVSDLPPDTTGLVEGITRVPGRVGLNDWKHAAWDGPMPPRGRHRYVFKLYALDRVLGLDLPTKRELERAMKDHVLAETSLIGTYERAS